MAWTLDARIPLLVTEDAAALAAALAAGPPGGGAGRGAGAYATGGRRGAGQLRCAHNPMLSACACCGGRSPAATALDRLFQARVRGQCPWFDRVVALAETAEARAAIAAALVEDAVTAARFRGV